MHCSDILMKGYSMVLLGCMAYQHPIELHCPSHITKMNGWMYDVHVPTIQFLCDCPGSKKTSNSWACSICTRRLWRDLALMPSMTTDHMMN